MTTFDKREDSFEKKFAHDEELQFRATARRNKRLAAWAAEKLGRRTRRRRTHADGDAVVPLPHARGGHARDAVDELERAADAGRERRSGGHRVAT